MEQGIRFLREYNNNRNNILFLSFLRSLPAVVVCCPSNEPDKTEVCSCSHPRPTTNSMANTQYHEQHSKAGETAMLTTAVKIKTSK